MINAVARPISLFDFRQFRARGLDEGPMNMAFGLLIRGGFGALVYPTGDKIDLGIAEGRLLVRHARDVFVRSFNSLHENALGALARNERRTGIAAFERERRGVH